MWTRESILSFNITNEWILGGTICFNFQVLCWIYLSKVVEIFPLASTSACLTLCHCSVYINLVVLVSSDLCRVENLLEMSNGQDVTLTAAVITQLKNIQLFW